MGATFLFMGLIVSAYGPLLEHLTRRFGVSLPVAGATISIHFAGSLIGVFVAMRSMHAWPARNTVVAAMGCVAAGCAAVALAPSWPAFVGAVFVIGVGFGALVLGLNQLVAYSEGTRRAALLSALNGAYSGGAVAGPILVAAFAAAHFSLLYLGAAAVALAAVPGEWGITGRLPIAGGARGRPGVLVLIFVCAFVLYVGIENGTGGWMTRLAIGAGRNDHIWFLARPSHGAPPNDPYAIARSRAEDRPVRRRGGGDHVIGGFTPHGCAGGLCPDGPCAGPDLSHRHRLAGEAASRRCASDLVVVPGRLDRRYARSGRDRPCGRGFWSGMDPVRARDGRRRNGRRL
ncbi:MAG: MFS transporter, partial [Chloroflexi bacterium]